MFAMSSKRDPRSDDIIHIVSLALHGDFFYFFATIFNSHCRLVVVFATIFRCYCSITLCSIESSTQI
jgi:hypothetical protein